MYGSSLWTLIECGESSANTFHINFLYFAAFERCVCFSMEKSGYLKEKRLHKDKRRAILNFAVTPKSVLRGNREKSKKVVLN